MKPTLFQSCQIAPCQILPQKIPLSDYNNQRFEVLNKTNLAEFSSGKSFTQENLVQNFNDDDNMGDKLENYRWVYGEWTKCSVSCLGGTYFFVFKLFLINIIEINN